MIIKILVIGFWKYVCNKWNLFDGIIILASVVAYFQGTSTGISMFRILRLVSEPCFYLSVSTNFSLTHFMFVSFLAQSSLPWSIMGNHGKAHSSDCS